MFPPAFEGKPPGGKSRSPIKLKSNKKSTLYQGEIVCFQGKLGNSKEKDEQGRMLWVPVFRRFP